MNRNKPKKIGSVWFDYEQCTPDPQLKRKKKKFFGF